MQLPMQSDEDDFSSTKPKRLHEQGTPQSGTILQEALQSTEGPQPGKQGNSQRLGSANSAAPIQTPSQRPVYKQTLLTTQSLQSSQTTESTMSSGVTPKPYAANSILVQRGAPITDSTANPCSDGRSIVISGFKRGIAGFEAKERALAACKPFGAVGSSWVRKGRTGCWFVIAQFDEVSLSAITNSE